MIKNILILFIFLFPYGIFAEDLPSSGLEVRSTIETSDSSYQFDVTKVNASILHKITIKCIDGCKSNLVYNEDSPDNPTYAMVSKDGSDRLITLWTTGSAYKIIVYLLTKDGVKKVISVGSKYPPDIATDSDGNEKLTLHINENKRAIYTWSKDHYTVNNN